MKPSQHPLFLLVLSTFLQINDVVHNIKTGTTKNNSASQQQHATAWKKFNGSENHTRESERRHGIILRASVKAHKGLLLFASPIAMYCNDFVVTNTPNELTWWTPAASRHCRWQSEHKEKNSSYLDEKWKIVDNFSHLFLVSSKCIQLNYIIFSPL